MPELSILILVTARGGSKRLPGKNLRELAGKPLLARTAEAIAESGLDLPVLLSTDDEAIASEGRQAGWDVPALRPAELARDDTPHIDVALYELDRFRERTGSDPDALMVLQPTSPLRGGACLDEAVRLLHARPNADSIIAMTELHVSAEHLYYADTDGIGVPLTRDARRPVYAPNGALYLTRTQPLRAQNTLYAGKILPIVLDPVRSIDIDTEADWFLAEAILAGGALPEATDFAPKPAV